MSQTQSYKKALDLLQQGKYKKALLTVNKAKSDTVDLLFLKVQLLNNLKQYSQAVITGKLLLNNHTLNSAQQCQLFSFIGMHYKNNNDFYHAIDYLEKSNKLDPTVTNANVILNLAVLYISTRNIVAFEVLAKKLLHWQDYFTNTYLLMLDSAVLKQDKPLLKQRLIALSPYFKQLNEFGIGKVATFLIALDLSKEFNLLIAAAQLTYPHLIDDLYISYEFEASNYAKVNKALSRQKLFDTANIPLYYLAAESLHKSKLFNKAFDLYTVAANFAYEETKGLPFNFNNEVTSWRKFSENRPYKNEPESEIMPYPDLAVKLVFIVGFPRSGTTLIDNIIDTQTDTLVFSESGVFEQLINVMEFALNKKTPQDINKLSEKDIVYLRDVYFKTIANMGFDINNYAMVVEKNPSYSHIIPLINRIFPEAKLVKVMRNPLDVCLSCFQKNFISTNFNNHLIRLTDVVDSYVKIEKLFESYTDNLAITPYQIQYEKLVDNIEKEVNDLFNYLEYEPIDEYNNFNEHANEKYVASASRGQTNKALTTTATNRWHDYHQYLEKYLPKLAPILQKYNY